MPITKTPFSLANSLAITACADNLRKLRGLPPYDNGMNPCRNDGYFGANLLKQYDPMVYKEAEKIIKEEEKAWDLMRKAFLLLRGLKDKP